MILERNDIVLYSFFYDNAVNIHVNVIAAYHDISVFYRIVNTC